MRPHDVPYAIIHDPAMGDKSLVDMLLRREDVMAHLSRRLEPKEAEG
jgi:hypothetical protein